MRFKRKYIIVSLVILLLLLAIFIFVYVEYTKHDIPVIEGRMEALSYHASSKVAGRIEQLFVDEGDWVESGELLYVISTPELDAKLMQVDALRTQAEALNEEVEKGARIEQLEALQGVVRGAEAGRILAEESFRRVEELYGKGVVPRQQYDEALANLNAMSASESAARAEYNLALAGATREQREAVWAKVTQAQGAVDELTAYIADRYVYAPASGRVTNIIAHEGELVGTGYPVVTILDVDNCWATFNIREDNIHGIDVGDRFTAYLPALDTDMEFEIYYIASEADFATWNSTRAKGGYDLRTFEVRARPINAKQTPLPGMSVVVRGDRL
jgi:HlyD family secretion protein